jgi:hypothetical protein
MIVLEAFAWFAFALFSCVALDFEIYRLLPHMLMGLMAGSFSLWQVQKNLIHERSVDPAEPATKTTWHREEKTLCLLLWYVPLCISATGDKYFGLLSCRIINWFALSNSTAAVFLLVLIPVIYFGSFAHRRLHLRICFLFCLDGLLGYLMIEPYIKWFGDFRLHITDIRWPSNIIWFEVDAYRAYFWKPFFDFIGLKLREDNLFLWGNFAGSLFPFVISLTNIRSLDTALGIVHKYEWKRNKAVLAPLFFILSVLGFGLVKSAYDGLNERAERSAQMKQEFVSHLEAAESGNIPSMARVGIHYWNGVGTEYDTAEAIRWLEKGAQNGSSEAMYFLGKVYYTGYRTGRDWDKARYWLTSAIEADPEETKYAQGILDRIDKGLLPFSKSAGFHEP